MIKTEKANYIEIANNIQKSMSSRSYYHHHNDKKVIELSEETVEFFKSCKEDEVEELIQSINEYSKKRLENWWFFSKIDRVFHWLSNGLYDSDFDDIAENMQKILLDGKASKEIQLSIYNSGLYKSNEEVEDYILKNHSNFSVDVLIKVLTGCSIEKVKAFKNHKIGKVRFLVYSRLGVPDYIEDIAKDNFGKVRMLALQYLPKNDKRLSLFINKEKSGQNLIVLASKVRQSDLPFLISKSSKSAWSKKVLERILESRMS